MKLTQDLMNAYCAAATDNGMKNWSERNDEKGLQAMLDFLAPDPVTPDAQTRTSHELTQIRTLHSNAFNSRARIVGAAGAEHPDPEAPLFVRALDTVEEILRPWMRAES